MKDLKKCFPKWLVSAAALVLVLSMVLVPAVALSSSIGDMVGDRVEIDKPAYSTTFENNVYTVNINASYVNDVLENGDFNADILKENLPEPIYQLLVERDVAAVKATLEQMIKDVLADYFGGGSSSEGETTAPSEETTVAEANRPLGAGAENPTLPDVDIDLSNGITAETLESILGIVKDMRDEGLLTNEQIKDIVDLDAFVELFDHMTDEDGEPLIKIPVIEDENGALVEDYDQLIEDLLDGKHNDTIVKSEVKTEDITGTVDGDKLGEIELSMEDMLRILLEREILPIYEKLEMLYVLDHVGCPQYGDDSVTDDTYKSILPKAPYVYSSNSEVKLNVSALEQVLLAAVPTMAEMESALREGSNLLDLEFVLYNSEKRYADENDTIGETVYWVDSYRLVVRFNNDESEAEGREALADYIDELQAYGSYEYIAPDYTDYVNRYADIYADDASDGTFKLELHLPRGFFEAAIRAVDSTLPAMADINAKLNNPDYADPAGASALASRILQNCTLGELITILESADSEKLKDNLPADYDLDSTTTDRIRRYLVRGFNKLDELTERFDVAGTMTAMKAMLLDEGYTGTGVFVFREDFTVDAKEMAERAFDKLSREMPDAVDRNLKFTTIKHALEITIVMDDLYRVDYMDESGSSAAHDYLPADSALPIGWVKQGDLGTPKVVDVAGDFDPKTLMVTTVPTYDIKLTALRAARFDTTMINKDGEHDLEQKIHYYTVGSDLSDIKPRSVKSGYPAWTWDGAQWSASWVPPMDTDTHFIATSEIEVKTSSSTFEDAKGNSYTLEIDYTHEHTGAELLVDEKVVAVQEALEEAHPGYTYSWEIVPNPAPAAPAPYNSGRPLNNGSAGTPLTPDTLISYEDYPYGFTLKPVATPIQYTVEFKDENGKVTATYSFEGDAYTLDALKVAAPKAPAYYDDINWGTLAPADFAAFHTAVNDGTTLTIDYEFEATTYKVTFTWYTEWDKTAKSNEIAYTVKSFDRDSLLAGITLPTNGYGTDAWSDVPATFEEFIKSNTYAAKAKSYKVTFTWYTGWNQSAKSDEITYDITSNKTKVLSGITLPADGYGTDAWKHVPDSFAEFSKATTYEADDLIEYEVTFKVNGEVLEAADKVTYTIKTAPDTGKFPTLEGYNAIDWATYTFGKDLTITGTATPISVDTDPPETETETDPADTEPGTEPGTETDTEPGETNGKPGAADTETDTEPGDEDEGGFPWWIFLIIIPILAIAGALIYYFFFYRRREEEHDAHEEIADEDADAAATTDMAGAADEDDGELLFIPLGQEIPGEGDDDDFEIVDEVSAETVDELMTDIVAEHHLETSEEVGGVGKMGIINVGQISVTYERGDVVDLADLQSKGLVDDNIGRLKVLASGTLDKALSIKADAFSVQAIKMITLTGGHAIKIGGRNPGKIVIKDHDPDEDKFIPHPEYDATLSAEAEEADEDFETAEIVDDAEIAETAEAVEEVTEVEETAEATEEAIEVEETVEAVEEAIEVEETVEAAEEAVEVEETVEAVEEAIEVEETVEAAEEAPEVEETAEDQE